MKRAIIISLLIACTACVSGCGKKEVVYTIAPMLGSSDSEAVVISENGNVTNKEENEENLTDDVVFISGNSISENGTDADSISENAMQDVYIDREFNDEMAALMDEMDRAHEDFVRTHNFVSSEESGQIKAGEAYEIPAGTYRFWIEPSYGMSGVHIYDKETDEEIDHFLLHYDEAAGIDQKEMKTEIPENAYVQATLVNYERVQK